MPKRKYKCPAVGQLVTVKRKIDLYRRNAFFESGTVLYMTDGDWGPLLNPLLVDDIVMFLGIFEKDTPSSLLTGKSWSYKFLGDEGICYAHASYLMPSIWLSQHVRVVKNG